MEEEWVVLVDGVVWTDRLKNESECLYHIEESSENNRFNYNEEDFTYRKMTKKEMDAYD